jgi:hypothetical protein
MAKKKKGYDLLVDGRVIMNFRRKPKKKIRELARLHGIEFDPPVAEMEVEKCVTLGVPMKISTENAG